MSVQVKRRRDTAANVSAYAGAQGELIVDTTNNRVTVHDGSTPGGWPAAKLSEVVTGTAASSTLATGANGSTIGLKVVEQLVTLSGASTSATLTLGNGVLLGVGSRVVTAITGAPSFEVGYSGNPTAFGQTLNIAAGSTNAGGGGVQGAYGTFSVIVTATSGGFTGGQLRLAAYVLAVSPPTS